MTERTSPVMSSDANLIGFKVLVVEDEFHLATRIEQALRKAGADVLGPVAREDQAMALISDMVPSCAFVDINLGDGVRFVIADGLKEAKVPFIFLTGYDNVMIPERFDSIGRIRKPASYRLIVHAAQKMCHSTLENPAT